MERSRNELQWIVLDGLSKKHPTDRDREFREVWRAMAFERLTLGTSNILDHSIFLLLAGAGDLASEQAVARSWELLAGRPPSSARAAERLPRSVLQAGTLDEQVVYDTVFHAKTRKSSIFDPIAFDPISESSKLRVVVRRLTASAFWNRGTFFFSLLAVALSFWSSGREILFGMLLGMMGASFNEYLVHLGVGHASSKVATGFRRLGFVGLFAEEINLAHRVHHWKMKMDFRVEFTKPEFKERVDTYLRIEATKLVRGRVEAGITREDRAEVEIARIIREIIAGGYGVNGTWAGCLSMNLLAFPFFVLNVILAWMWGGPVFLVTSCLFLSGFITQSLYSHRYLHMTEEDLQRAKAAGQTTAFMLRFMKTSVSQLQARRHYRHHHERFDYNGTANGVIMSFSFADFVLRGGVREARVQHLVRMRKEGFLKSLSYRL